MCNDFLLQDLDAVTQELYEKQLAVLAKEAQVFGLAVIPPAELCECQAIEYTLGFEGVPCFKVQGPPLPMCEAELHQHFKREIQMNLGSCFLKGA